MDNDETTKDEPAVKDEPATTDEPIPAEEQAPILAPQDLRAILEALIFTAPQPLTAREIGQVEMRAVSEEEARTALAVVSDQ